MSQTLWNASPNTPPLRRGNGGRDWGLGERDRVASEKGLFRQTWAFVPPTLPGHRAHATLHMLVVRGAAAEGEPKKSKSPVVPVEPDNLAREADQ